MFAPIELGYSSFITRIIPSHLYKTSPRCNYKPWLITFGGPPLNAAFILCMKMEQRL